MEQTSSNIHRTPSPADLPSPSPVQDAPECTVVGIGASAGGVPALEAFLKALPADTAMSFVVLMHLAPDYESNLPHMLQQHTALKVQWVTEGIEPQRNAIYLNPPNKRLQLVGRKLRLSDEPSRRERTTAVDTLLRSLAEVQREKAIGIVLSGSGADGTLGLKAIKEQGGYVMVQDPSEAEFEGMPRCALQAGIVDVMVPAGQLPNRLMRFWQSGTEVRLPDTPDELTQADAEALLHVFEELSAGTGHDFSNHKRSTVLRRVRRRLHVNRLHALADYVEFLRREPGEVTALFEELLISVTSFFRDPAAFAALEQHVVPALFKDKDAGDRVRVWSAGCATGEEAYSLAILLLEEVARRERAPHVQVFATDLSAKAIERARKGVCSAAIVASLTPERLARYFIPEGGQYRVRPELRSVVLFAEHDVLSDPPFPKLDLVSCRNLLIYLNRRMQERVFRSFHYALNPEGYLFLGTSESVRAAPGLFAPLDEQHMLFQRRPHSREMILRSAVHRPLRVGRVPLTSGRTAQKDRYPEHMKELHKRLLLDEVASLVVNDNYQIIHLTEPASRFLTFRGGIPTHNVLDVLRPELQSEAWAALDETFREGRASEQRWVTVELDGHQEYVNLRVVPVDDYADETSVAQLLIHTVAPTPEPGTPPADQMIDVGRVRRLETELRRTKERLQAMSEQYETTTEEMEASNEELQSLNEELDSTNQELTVKVEELDRSNSDLQNLIEATNLPTLFLDLDLRIQRFTPRVPKLFNIQEVDVGRPIGDFSRRFRYTNIVTDARKVIETREPIEREFQNNTNHWFLMRMRPYQTVGTSHEITGVLITFVDITHRKEIELQLREERNFVNAVIDTVGAVIVVLDAEARVVRFNKACEVLTGYDAASAQGQNVLDLLIPDDERGEVQALFEELSEGGTLRKHEHHWLTKNGERRLIAWSKSTLDDAEGNVKYVIGTGIDITDHRRLEREVLAAGDAERRRIGQDLHDTLASHLVGTSMLAQAMARRLKKGGEAVSSTEIMKVVELINQAGQKARSLSHTLMPLKVFGGELSAALGMLATRHEEVSGIPCALEVHGDIPLLDVEVATQLYRIAQEALNNAIKHASPRRVDLRLSIEGKRLMLVVQDDGDGLQQDIRMSDGLGVRMMQYRANLIGAGFEISSSDGNGTRVACSITLHVEGNLDQEHEHEQNGGRSSPVSGIPFARTVE